MRYLVATLTAALMLLAGPGLSGAGHGWNAGGLGCFALAPVAFAAVANGFSHAPSLRAAVTILGIGLALCIVVGIATALEGTEYLRRFFRITGSYGLTVAVSAYVGWLVIALLGLIRAQRVLRHGT